MGKIKHKVPCVAQESGVKSSKTVRHMRSVRQSGIFLFSFVCLLFSAGCLSTVSGRKATMVNAITCWNKNNTDTGRRLITGREARKWHDQPQAAYWIARDYTGRSKRLDLVSSWILTSPQPEDDSKRYGAV